MRIPRGGLVSTAVNSLEGLKLFVGVAVGGTAVVSTAVNSLEGLKLVI